MFVKGFCKTSPTDVFCQNESFALCRQPILVIELVQEPDRFKVCLKSRLCTAEFTLVETDLVEVGIFGFLRFFPFRFFARFVCNRQFALVRLPILLVPIRKRLIDGFVPFFEELLFLFVGKRCKRFISAVFSVRSYKRAREILIVLR